MSRKDATTYCVKYAESFRDDMRQVMSEKQVNSSIKYVKGQCLKQLKEDGKLEVSKRGRKSKKSSDVVSK